MRQGLYSVRVKFFNSDTKLLNDAMTRLQLSARATFRILKIARTVADLDATERIATPHLIEAINYRRFDTP